MSPSTVARHEWRSVVRDRTFMATVGCLLVLLAAAFVSGRTMQREHERTRSAAQEESQRQWLTQGAKNPHSAAHFGVYAFRPLSSLALFEPGMHPFEGTSVYLEAHKANDLRDAPSEDASSLSRLGRPSAASLLRTLLPLVVFLLTASAFAGERERGTLKLLVAQGASLRTLFAGKALALGVVVVAFLLLVAAVTALEGGGAPLGARAAWLFVGYALYGFIALFIGLSVSLAARTARGAFVALFLVWAIEVLLAPRLATSVAVAAAPMPPAAAVRAELSRELDREGDARRLDELRARTLAKYGVTSERELPVDFAGLALQAGEEHAYPIFDRHRDRLRARAAAEDAWLDGLSAIAPALALERWSTALAGTDRAHVEHFADAAEGHRRELVERMNLYVAEHGAGAGFGLVANEEVWATVPAFGYTPPDVSFATKRSWSALGVLAGWTALALVVAMFALSRSRAAVTS
ncbi:MAG: DUF3526 domain-containing protein [Labilithrix sp.]|nr:DUF3526 domain-containing protein [Labilithrix sp.]MCW5817450.1 DUF3526 domain-containing protein [Labilithrix sp.]